MCVLTVAPLTTSAVAISVLERPAAISLRTSISRGVRSSGGGAVAGGGVEDGRDEALLDCRVEVRAPGGDGADRLFDLFGAGVFGQVAAGAGLQCGEQRLVVGIGGEDEDLRLGEGGADVACRLGAVHLGHAQVHEHDVGVRRRVRGRRPRCRRRRCRRPRCPRSGRRAWPVRRGRRAGRRRSDDADHAGTSNSTRQPVSVGPACMVPPARSSRSRIPIKPVPAADADEAGGVWLSARPAGPRRSASCVRCRSAGQRWWSRRARSGRRW